MNVTVNSNIVSCDWLFAQLEDPNLIILDATMKKKPNGELITQQFVYIPGTQEFNFDTEICDQKSSLPHMMPEAKAFTESARARGIMDDSTIVIYDAMGIFSSPRVWWMFKAMGHDKVYILNGGLPHWIESGYATSSQLADRNQKGNFQARFIDKMVYSSNQVNKAINSTDVQVIDARSVERFNGIEEEPRSGLRKGHIPGSDCLPFSDLIQQGQYLSRQDLSEKFQKLVRTNTRQLVFSCGSGVTACVLALAADECGYKQQAVYDGSWSEWGADEQWPVE